MKKWARSPTWTRSAVGRALPVASLILVLFLALAAPASARVSISGFIDLGYWAASNPDYGLTSATTGRPDRLQASTNTLGSHQGNDQFALNDIELSLEAELTERVSGVMVFNFGNGANPTIGEAFVTAEALTPLELDLTLGRLGSIFGIEQAFTGPVENPFITTSLLAPFTTGSLDGVAVALARGPFTLALAVSNDDLLPGATIGLNPLGAAGGGVAGALTENNNDRAVMGRIGWTGIDALTLGVSGSRTIWAAPVAAGSAVPDAINASRILLGLDADWTSGRWNLKGEYAVADEEQLYKLGAEVPIRWTGWRVGGWFEATAALGIGARFARIQTRQATNILVPPGNVALVSDYSALTLGVRWRPAERLIGKVEFTRNKESVLERASVAGRETDNDVLALSLIATF